MKRKCGGARKRLGRQSPADLPRSGRPVPPLTGVERQLLRAVSLRVVELEDHSYVIEGGAVPHRVSRDLQCDCLSFATGSAQRCKHTTAVRIVTGHETTLADLRALARRLLQDYHLAPRPRKAAR